MRSMTKKMKELEVLNSTLTEEKNKIEKELGNMREINKTLLRTLTKEQLAKIKLQPHLQSEYDSEGEPGGGSFGASVGNSRSMEPGAGAGGGGSEEISPLGDVHSLYHDLYLHDMKKEIAKQQKENRVKSTQINHAHKTLKSSKKENLKLNAVIKRYRSMLNELNNLYVKTQKKSRIDNTDSTMTFHRSLSREFSFLIICFFFN